jgi:hypothetical protein
VLSSLSLTVLPWGDVCMQKDKDGRPPASTESGKQLQRNVVGGQIPHALQVPIHKQGDVRKDHARRASPAMCGQVEGAQERAAQAGPGLPKEVASDRLLRKRGSWDRGCEQSASAAQS